MPKDWSVTDWVAQPAEVVVTDPAEEAQIVAPVPDPELACAFEQAVQADRAPAVPVLGNVVSVTRGGRHRKLHHVGSRRFVPGVDYQDIEICGDVMPSKSEVDSRCSWCFGCGLALEPALEEEGSEAESLDSSSSSTVERPAPKRARS